MGAFGAYSFHGTKTISTGEGGILVTNDRVIFERALTIAIMVAQRILIGSFGLSGSDSNTKCPTCRQQWDAPNWSESMN